MNKIMLEKTEKYICASKKILEDTVESIESKTEGIIKKKIIQEKVTNEGNVYFVLTITEEFAKEKSVIK